MLKTAFTPIFPPSEDMFSSTVTTRCGVSQTSIPLAFPGSLPSETLQGAQGLSNFHCQVPSLEEKDCGDFESCQFNKRKSTACETELDFSSEHSLQDTPLPQEPKPQRKPSLLANLSVPDSRRFETVILEVSDDEDDGIELGKRRPSSFTCHTSDFQQPIKQTCSEQHVFSLSCRFGHKSPMLSELTPDSEDWCQTCRTQLGALRQFAEERGGKCMSQALEPEVLFECGLHHQWRVPLKRATRNWCKLCKTKKKQLLKDLLEQETAVADEERKQRQNKMLEESRQRLLANEKMQRDSHGQELDNFRLILEEITRIASKYAREYCQKDSTADFGQILLLYQTLILPEKSLATHLRSMPKEDLKKEFRRYTILLHPDKNSHPKAKQAFQKAYALFTEHCN